MTSPNLAVDSPFGRLYQHPLNRVEGDAVTRGADKVWDLVEQGLLMPSVTNVIDVANKPFLKKWAARLAAEAAIDAAIQHAEETSMRPQAASRWAAEASERTLHAAAQLGDEVHNICEARALGDTPPVSAAAAPYERSWEQWVADYQPSFTRVEATTFGTSTPDSGDPGLLYAGTGDAFIQMSGTLYVADYKTGKRVYDSAAIQLAALANAHSIIDPDEMGVTSNLPVTRGLVVHLTPSKYVLHQVDTSQGGVPWRSFQAYRTAWQYHAPQLAARSPILLQTPPSKPTTLTQSEVA